MCLHELFRAVLPACTFSNKLHRHAQFLRARALHAWKYLVIVVLYRINIASILPRRLRAAEYVTFRWISTELILRVCQSTYFRNLFLPLSLAVYFGSFLSTSPNIPSKRPWPYPRPVPWLYRRLLCHVHQILFDYLVLKGPEAPERYSLFATMVLRKRFVLTYSSRIYLDPWKLRDRTAPSRYFPFYDSSTYDAFKPVKRGARRTPHRIVSTPVFRTEAPTILRS